MFKQNTVFVLGAGASYPYNYPLSEVLIQQIINDMENDVIFLPYSDIKNEVGNSKYFWNEHDYAGNKTYEFNDFKEKLMQSNIDSLGKFSQTTDYNGEHKNIFSNSNGTLWYRIKLNFIDEFKEFKQSLIDFAPISIDVFLRDNPCFQEIGKTMIVYSLLKKEEPAIFGMSGFRDINAVQNNSSDNWYSYLINDLVSSCTKPDDLLKNMSTFKIITFNYDLSIEFCLIKKLKSMDFFKKDGGKIVDQFIEYLLNEGIRHVYGKLYTDDVLNWYGKFNDQVSGKQTDRSSNFIYQNTRRLLKAFHGKDTIKTIHQERQEDLENLSVIKQNITNADELIIIGFGFDRDNLTNLSFPTSFKEYGSWRKNKPLKIKYLNFAGKITALALEFDKIREKSTSSVTTVCSTATRITDAYMNDFKILLF